MKPLDLYLVQMDIVFGQKKKNFQKAQQFINQIKLNPSSSEHQLICFPELFSTSYDFKNIGLQAENLTDGETISFLIDLAVDYNVSIITSLLEYEDGHYYNTGVLIDAKGTLLGKYRKNHLFPLPPMDETQFLTPGKLPENGIQTSYANIGIQICYDLRFPENSRTLAKSGVEVLIYVAEFPKPRDYVWTTLLQARAIENQVFVAGVNRVGTIPGACFFGLSMIVDPSGTILIKGSQAEENISAFLDPKQIDIARNFLKTI
ncbi:nitrilase-related carbon-nitrogen hydrolase [Candidatus Hodarchaeum mangrovi]